MSDQRYNTGMKRLANTFNFEDNNVAAFRMTVLKHAQEFGWQSACDAFNVSKASYFRWQKALQSNGLSGLVPESTKPHSYRQSHINPQIISYIKELRHDNGNIGSFKLKIFVDEYAKQIGVSTVSRRTIDRIIAKYNLYEPTKRRQTIRRKLPVNRSKYAPKVNETGFVEIDCITMHYMCKKFLFVSCIDVYSRYAYVEQVSSLTSANAKQVFENCQDNLPFSITTVQTDNGSEFLKDFDQHLADLNIPHYFTLPHSPKVNGCVERFNRTIQEEFLNRTDSMLFSPKHFKYELIDWISWYNECRPHAGLNFQTPCDFLKTC